MDMRNAKGERWAVGGDEKSNLLFKEYEIEKASAIAETLSGFTIEEARKILQKVSVVIEQLVVVP